LGASGLALVPTLAPEAVDGEVSDFKLPQCLGSNFTGWMAAPAGGSEIRSAFEVHNGFGHNGTCRISGAQKQYVVVSLHWFHGPHESAHELAIYLGAIASTSMFWPERNSRASSTR
jgi:hypothetical protein